MKTRLICLIVPFLVCCTCFFGCSKDDGVESKKGRIGKMTDHAAEVIVEHLQAPIEKARSVKEMEKARMKGVDEALKE